MNDQNPTDSGDVNASDLFRARRERLGASQGEVAEEAGVNRDTVSAVEHGTASPRSRRLVAEALTRIEKEAGLLPIGESLVSRIGPVEGAPDLIYVEVPGVHGAEALIVRAPVDKPEELAAAVDAIMRRLYPPPPPEV